MAVFPQRLHCCDIIVAVERNMSQLFIPVLLCYWREIIAEPSDSESSLSLAALAVRNLMSPPVVITEGLMIRNVKGDRKLTDLYFL